MIRKVQKGFNSATLRSKIRWSVRCLAGFWLLLVILTHWPNPWPNSGEPQHFDKLVHFSLYGVLATLAVHVVTIRSVTYPRHLTLGRNIDVLALVVAFALFDEATQPLTGRDFDWFDWLADSLGALTAIVLYNAWRLRGIPSNRGESNMASFKQLTDFLVSLGTDKVPHTNEIFLAHLIGVYRDLETWGCDDALCAAGMFHSIYGTERFQRFSLPLSRRGEVRDLIGTRAEWLAYVNCFMDRASFDRVAFGDGENYRFKHRLSGEEMVLSRAEFDDLARIHLCDWLEQVPRSKEWDYRRPVYRRLAQRLGGVALEAYDRVFTMETASSAMV